MRSKRTRCPPASTMAMLTGLRNSLARCLLASSILRAISIDMLTQILPFKTYKNTIIPIAWIRCIGYTDTIPHRSLLDCDPLYSIKYIHAMCKYLHILQRIVRLY